MAIGRIFPIPNPLRMFPVDPKQHGDTFRDAPLPFRLGASASSNIETTYVMRALLSTTISAILNPDDPGGGGGGTGSGGVITCNPITNQFCVPTGTITRVDAPVGTIRCAIT